MNGIKDDSSVFEYTSPPATNSVGNSIEICFKGLEGLPFVQVRQKRDNTFSLKLMRDLITQEDNGTYKFTVLLDDGSRNLITSYSIEININYSSERDDVTSSR